MACLPLRFNGASTVLRAFGIGELPGDYDNQCFSADRFVSVTYFWTFDCLLLA